MDDLSACAGVGFADSVGFANSTSRQDHSAAEGRARRNRPGVCFVWGKFVEVRGAETPGLVLP